jgi:hypothetical protein
VNQYNAGCTEVKGKKSVEITDKNGINLIADAAARRSWFVICGSGMEYSGEYKRL